MAKVVTITNPVTGQPAQVDQLDHTAQQIDDAVAAARWSHRNLLDNAYWANPDAIIDQRGGYVVPPGIAAYRDAALSVQTGGVTDMYYKIVERTSTYGRFVGNDSLDYYVAASACVRGYVGAGYTIDRWKVSSGSSQYSVVLINDDSISLQFTPGTSGSQFVQISEIIDLDLTGFTVTISVLTKDNELLTATGVLSTNYFAAGDLSKFYAAVLMTGGRISFSIVNKLSTAKSFHAAKLELGTVQTLAHQDENGNWALNDPPPDKGLELLKCIQSTADPGDGYANKVVLHTGNKPSGSYTGNGSAAARTINTGGIGNALIVYSTTHTFVLSPYGGFSIVNGQGTVSGIPASVANFSNGILTITSATTLNVSSGIYYYQVL